jgi:hypothetical protein
MNFNTKNKTDNTASGVASGNADGRADASASGRAKKTTPKDGFFSMLKINQLIQLTT